MTITINNKTLELVEVPEDAYFFSTYITKEGIPSIDFEILDDDCRPIDWDFIELPTGSYTILLKASEATEEQAREIVEEELRPDFDDSCGLTVAGYTNYSGNGLCDTATESLSSLIRSLGMEPEKTLILKKEKL